MINLLIRIFISDFSNTDSPQVRQQYGILSGSVGICFNTLLFSFKLMAGLLSGSISIVADAFNNLSDAASSVITLFGFKIAGQKADSDHPFGHGRSEYISGLIIAIIIIFMAVELLRSSIEKILHPTDVIITPLVLGILFVSILVKLYMYCYNKSLSRKISSSALRAAATDSSNDAFSTLAVLIAALISQASGMHIDGWCGVFVGLLILLNGIETVKDTISPLLGQAPDADFIEKIHHIVNQYDEVLDTHDLIVHDYGPGRRMISLHAEVPAKGDILALHDTIDNIEKRLQRELHCSAVIHMDPVMNDDEETLQCKALTSDILKSIDSALTLHDFRIVKGTTHTNFIFDVVVPYQSAHSAEALKATIEYRLKEVNPQYYASIEIDYS